ncbi:MAG: ribonuclease P protein component [Arcobacteraceae bacterium]|nr:ribonuclease P protein component [Arcobacteraceae bacterium]
MSCLSKQHRVKTTKEFNQIYKSNKRWHTISFVAFFKSSKNETINIGFVASKKIGNAVKRNRAKRLLRSLVLNQELNLANGQYVFIAKAEIFNRDYKTLQKDFKYAMKKLDIF